MRPPNTLRDRSVTLLKIATLPQRLLAIPLVTLVLLTIGCGVESGGASGDNENGELTVAAAASMQFAFEELGRRYEEQTGREVILSFGSSGNLAIQIEQGAPFDVYAAANVAYVDDLIEGDHLVEDSRVHYAAGRVVLASNIESGVEAQSLEDLADPEIRTVAIANPEFAPYGMAAQQVLESAGLWDELEPKIVYGQNVRQALQFVQTGDAEAGIVALSIADVPEVDYVTIDEGLHETLLQAMAVVSRSEHGDAAQEFITFVTGAEGQAILNEFGFSSPENGQ